MRFIDANIILRYLVEARTEPDRARQEACTLLFQRVKAADEKITTCEAVLAEILFVLTSPRQYQLSHEEAAGRLRPLFALPNLQLPRKRVYLRALELYALNPDLDFPDVLSVAYMERDGIEEIYSYGTDFDRFQQIERREPE